MNRPGPPFVLTEAEYELVGALAEMIIPSGMDPRTDPGAVEVGVKNFFDSCLLEMGAAQRNRVLETLARIEARSGSLYSRRFALLGPRERETLLRGFLAEGSDRQRFVEIRALCVTGFYSDYRDPWYEGKGAWEWLEYGGKRISDVKKDWSFLRVYRGGSSPGR